MKVNSINASIPFRGISSTDKQVPKDLFGKRQSEIEALSDAKDLNVWALKSTGGCMVNPQSGYLVLLQGKDDGIILKELKCGISDESKEELNRKLEQCLIWANAESNISAAQQLQNTKFAKENPKGLQVLQTLLFQTGASSESKIWRERLDMIV